MSGSGALAITGAVLLVAAIVLAFAATEAAWGDEKVLRARIGWTVFALACACFIGAVWWAAA